MIPKFRAWNKKTKTIQEVVAIWTEYFINVVVRNGGTVDTLFDDFELMQSTGLKDKNGVEIYEGDIVKVTSIQDGEYYTTDVYWGGNDDYSAFDLNAEHISSDWFYDSNILSAVFVNSAHESIEILGNIYENTELLEE